MSLLDNLNPEQREAVTAIGGPVLVLAGAGSGKTRVITYRVAYLLQTGIAPERILAVTFTNKAAEQMKERVAALVGGLDPAPWISTFHSFCARLLRREIAALGYRRDFAIYDEEDQASVIKRALRQLGLDEAVFTPRSVAERISRAKNDSLAPELFFARAMSERDAKIASVYQAYEHLLRQANALDFDDLLLKAVLLLSKHGDVRERYNARFLHILVDEYQDTNRPQYELIRLLSERHKNLCVVGDEDQSIYGWRGADVGHILRFEKDFPGTRMIKLEQNYRSTQMILSAASAVVRKNERRIGKTLLAVRPGGETLRYFEAQDVEDEAAFVAAETDRFQRQAPPPSAGQAPKSRIAVLYRTNFQSRPMEEALRRYGIHYRVVGGISFYERAEVKDLLAYARLGINPEDSAALLRIINVPPRGIGKATLESLHEAAKETNGSLWAALGSLIESAGGGRLRSVEPLRHFRRLVEEIAARISSLGLADLFRWILEHTGYLDMLQQALNHTGSGQAGGEEASPRLENLTELVNAAGEAEDRGDTLEEFLDHSALMSDADEYDERAPVSLMTLHSAKGLEFESVFLIGMEEGLFPHARSLGTQEELEEERRLCYVGMTRAQDALTLTGARYRRFYGSELAEVSEPSRFLSEIPFDSVERVGQEAARILYSDETVTYVRDDEYDQAQMRWRRNPASRRPRFDRGAGKPVPASRRLDPLIGQRVSHPTYGVGTVLAVEGDGPDRKITVSFPGYGRKKLVERYAKLERA